MYLFYPVNNNKTNLDVVVTRAMFAVAAAAAFARYADFGLLSIFAAAGLIIAAVYLKVLLRFLKAPVIVMLVIAIVVLCLLTWSPYFAIVLVLHWALEKFIAKEPKYAIDLNGVKITKLLSEKLYTWADVQNVVLKDGLLTIDFKTNHIFQSPVTAKNVELDEKSFNQFCRQQLQTTNHQP